jgi:arsenite methyltransferase
MEWLAKKTGLGKHSRGAHEYCHEVQDTMGHLRSCTTAAAPDMSGRIKETMGHIHEDVIKRNYGCGLPYPEAIEGCKVLDLGSGTGRDAYVLSKLVGPEGRVIGVEKDQHQLDIALKYLDHHTKQFDYETPNVEFNKGNLEDLEAAGIPDEFDVVVSNCAINLSENKRAALKEAHRVLKNGGELYYSDIYSDKEIPLEIPKGKEAWESPSGVMYWRDLQKICSDLGFSRPILVSSKHFPLRHEDVEKEAGVHFVCATYRIFKIDLKTIAEIGHPAKVTYKGDIPEHENAFKLADGIVFPAGKPVHIEADLTAILKLSRFDKYFDYEPSEDKNQIYVAIKETDPFSCAQPCAA